MLEREVVRLVIARWRPQFGAELEGHVRAEEAARQAGEARVSIRLAGEFHTKLGAMTGNALLGRYLGEVVSRCSLILALYGRPHSADCAVNEHREIVAALRAGNAEAAIKVMERASGLGRAARAARSGPRGRTSISAPCCRAMPTISTARPRQRSHGSPDRRPGASDDPVDPALSGIPHATSCCLSFTCPRRPRAARRSSVHDQVFPFPPSLSRRRRRGALRAFRPRLARARRGISPSASSTSDRAPTTAGTRHMRSPRRR